MICFDYLRDTPPDSVEFLVQWRLPKRLQGVAVGFFTIVAIAAAAACIEWFRIGSALGQESKAEATFEDSKTRLASAQLSYAGVERLLAVDRALARVRSSGDSVASKVKVIGNAIPRGAWLDAIEPGSDGGTDVRGEATNLDAVDVVLAALASREGRERERLISVTRRARIVLAPTVAFELRLSDNR